MDDAGIERCNLDSKRQMEIHQEKYKCIVDGRQVQVNASFYEDDELTVRPVIYIQTLYRNRNPTLQFILSQDSE